MDMNEGICYFISSFIMVTYVIGQAIIFFALWFLLSSSFFPCIISVVADWMSTILPHMVWL